jgi:hypothetical protein
MKKLLLIFFTTILWSCSSDDSTSNNTVNYSFEIEFGGEIHKIQGNLSNDIFTPLPTNHSLVLVGPGVMSVQLNLNDISASNYVSGQTIGAMMNIENTAIGVNEGSLYLNTITNPYVENYLQSVGVPEGLSSYGFVENTSGPFGSDDVFRITNINITDLGTSSTADPTNGTYNWGETIKGSYDGTLYFLSSTPEGFTIPVPIKIQFSAFRYAQ